MNTRETIIAIDKEHLKQLIKKEIKKNGNKCNLNHINVSNVKNMIDMFYGSQFNGDISKWDVSNVKSMDSMFSYSQFKGNISRWDVSHVENMKYLFYESQFNGDISQWNVSNVKDMNSMFYNSQFNGDISKWDIRKVEYIGDIFEDSNNANIPYWVNFNTKKERIVAYDKYLLQQQLINDLPQKNNKQQNKIKL